MDSTSKKSSRQRQLFVGLLLLLWGVVIAIMFLQYYIVKSRELQLVAIAVATSLILIIGFIASHLYTRLERQARERELEHVMKLREEREKIKVRKQLTNNINHELKTPITSIIGYLDMVVNNPNISHEQAMEFVKKSYSQAERLRLLMSDLSTITRIEEGGEMIEQTTVYIDELIANLIDDILPQSRRKFIKVLTNITTPLPIMGNEMLLYSIFRNLVDNAIEYSGGRHIWVELVERDEDEVDDGLYHFSIRDNGIGVEYSHLPYLFERFYRVDGGRSRKLGGTGLGLSIVKNAVVFHGGTISANLWKMGGLDFRFSLKRSDDEI